MRLMAGFLAALLGSGASIQADDAADGKAIVTRAIKASGQTPDGKPVLLTWKDMGTFSGGGFDMKYTGDWAYQGPDKYRFKISGDFGGMKVEIVVAVNGKKAWETAFGTTQEITGEKLDATLTEVYQFQVLSLVPLVTDKEFKLTAAGEKKINGKDAAAVKVTREKQPPVTLYFDKTTGLLSKCEMSVKDEFNAWKEVPEETYFEEYKDVGGRKFFTKMKVVRDGKTMIEATVSDQKVPEKLDPKIFERPEK